MQWCAAGPRHSQAGSRKRPRTRQAEGGAILALNFLRIWHQLEAERPRQVARGPIHAAHLPPAHVSAAHIAHQERSRRTLATAGRGHSLQWHKWGVKAHPCPRLRRRLVGFGRPLVRHGCRELYPTVAHCGNTKSTSKLVKSGRSHQNKFPHCAFLRACRPGPPASWGSRSPRAGRLWSGPWTTS